MMKAKEIIFYAPLGHSTKGSKIGGAEVGCQKTIEILQKAGFNLILVEKPAKNDASLISGIKHIFRLLGTWLQLIRVFRAHPNAVLHVAGFYLNQIYIEFLLVKTASLFKIPVLYEIRNGGMTEAYKKGNSLYRFFMKSVLRLADVLLCQGYEYMTFIHENLGKQSFYYPNYIMDKYMAAYNPNREQDLLRLVYFGRVVPHKNIGFILDVCQEIQKRGTLFHLDIIGGYDEDYYVKLTDYIHTHSLEDKVTFRGRLEFSSIHSYLTRSHFFLFPSKEKREGHSNSLTEAMGCGVVPIVSNIGFNASVVGNNDLVISAYDPEIYADHIQKIWDSGDWTGYSEEVYHRVKQNYTESIVKNMLLKAYASFDTVL